MAQTNIAAVYGQNGSTITRSSGAFTAASGAVAICINTDTQLSALEVREQLNAAIRAMNEDFLDANFNTQLPTS